MVRYDCGGIHGYHELVDAVSEPEHLDLAEMLDWLGPYGRGPKGYSDPAYISIEDLDARRPRCPRELTLTPSFGQGRADPTVRLRLSLEVSSRAAILVRGSGHSYRVCAKPMHPRAITPLDRTLTSTYPSRATSRLQGIESGEPGWEGQDRPTRGQR